MTRTQTARLAPTIRTADPADDSGRYEISADVVMLAPDRTAEAEAIRTMRTHVVARHLHDGRRGLTICAATAGVGCSLVAVNLAVALSQVGVSTLLVDGDLRTPSLEAFIKPPKAAQGLRQAVAVSNGDPRDFIHWNVLPDLSVFYSGGVAEHPQEVLGSDAFQTLIESCLRDFDCTIIDSPPVGQYADARRISSLVGYGVIVARRNVSLLSDLKALAIQMREDGVGLVGTVLNEV